MYNKALKNKEKIEMLAKNILNGTIYERMEDKTRYGKFVMQLSIIWGDIYTNFYNKFIKQIADDKKVMYEVDFTKKLRQNAKEATTNQKYTDMMISWEYEKDYKVFKKGKAWWCWYIVVGIPYDSEKWVKCWYSEIIREKHCPDLYKKLEKNKKTEFTF